MFGLDDAIVARLAGPAIAAAVAVGVGFGAAEVYEHRAPWGMMHKLDSLRSSIPDIQKRAEADGARAQAAVDKPAFEAWAARLGECVASRATDSTSAAAARDQDLRNMDASRRAAYRLGQASCGGSDAPTTTHPDSPAVPGGVPAGDADLASVLGAAAYSPAPGGGRPSSR